MHTLSYRQACDNISKSLQEICLEKQGDWCGKSREGSNFVLFLLQYRTCVIYYKLDKQMNITLYIRT